MKQNVSTHYISFTCFQRHFCYSWWRPRGKKSSISIVYCAMRKFINILPYLHVAMSLYTINATCIIPVLLTRDTVDNNYVAANLLQINKSVVALWNWWLRSRAGEGILQWILSWWWCSTYIIVRANVEWTACWHGMQNYQGHWLRQPKHIYWYIVILYSLRMIYGYCRSIMNSFWWHMHAWVSHMHSLVMHCCRIELESLTQRVTYWCHIILWSRNYYLLLIMTLYT